MESNLHRELKRIYGEGGRSEVAVGGYRVDAVAADGRLIEIQGGPLRLLKAKLAGLLPDHRVVVVKPVIVARRLVRRCRATGLDLKPRRSPSRGTLLDAFEELVSLAPRLADPGLQVDLVAVEVEEVRVDRPRRPGFDVVDRRLLGVVETVSIRTGGDLWGILPDLGPGPFTPLDLAGALGRPIGFARQVAYCLHRSGATRKVGNLRRSRLYARVAD